MEGISTDTNNIEKKLIAGQEYIFIGTELYREYVFSENIYRIKSPEWLFVRPSGSHTVIDKDGVAHYVKSEFYSIRWKNEDNKVPANF